jgi:hypothetical protein
MVGWGDFKWYHIIAMPWFGLLELTRRVLYGEFNNVMRDWRGALICLTFVAVEVGVVTSVIWLLSRLV